MSVYSIAFLKGWADSIFDLQFLALLNLLLGPLTVFWEGILERIDPLL